MSEEDKNSPPSVTNIGTPCGSYYKLDAEVICQYKGNCSDEGYCCKTCKNNTGKRSHYKPDIPPCPNPAIPYVPMWPHYPYIGDPPKRKPPIRWYESAYY